jgi:DNA-directed RNA polymerase II subunit RPB2
MSNIDNYINSLNSNSSLNSNKMQDGGKLNKKTTKTANKTTNKIDTNNDNYDNSITTNNIFRLTDLYFYKKNYIYRHLHNSYDKLIDEDIKNFLERTDHIFNEKIVEDVSKKNNTNIYSIYRRKFRFKNTRVIGPKMENGIEPMFPSDVRYRSQTYGLKLICDVVQIQEKIDILTDKRTETITGSEELDVPIGLIPLMVRSKYCSLNQYKGLDKSECEYDPGGYFIVNGSEKVVIPQDRMVENKTLVFLKKDSGTMSYIVQVNSRSYKPNGITQVMNIKIRKDGLMTIRVPILNEVNVFAIFRALGVSSDKDIIRMIIEDDNDTDMIEMLRKTLDVCQNESHQKIQTEEEAYDYLISKLKVIRKYTEHDKDIKNHQKKIHLKSLLLNSFIPHIEGGLMEKAYYLSYMILKLLKVSMGRTIVDNRDSYINKRVDLPGDLLFELFKQRFKIMMNDCNKFFINRNDNDERPLNIINQIKPNTIEQGIKASLLTGSWIRKKGVAQMLQRYTYLQTLAFLRRVDTPSGDASTNKLTGPRQLHPSSVGFLCIIETPEHAKVGVTKHLSLIGSVTIMSEDQYTLLRDIITDSPYIKHILNCSIEEIRSMLKIFLNGEWLGLTDKPIEFIEKINSMKNNGELDKQMVSIVPSYTDNEIRIYCDSGRFFRPLMKVVNNEVQIKSSYIDRISLNKLQKTTKITDWDAFQNEYPNSIEYVCSELQPYILIAAKVDDLIKMKKIMINSIESGKKVSSGEVKNRYNESFFLKYTHCEFHPSLLLGEINTNVPFSNRNPANRNIFQYSQGRQAMGIYSTNYRNRTDISYILHHLQKPMVTTRTAKYVGSEILASGENAMVAIACYTGYNQEDSLIMNRDSVQRGMFRSKSLKKYISIAQKNQSTAQDDIFMKPDATKVVGIKHGSYDKLNDKGFIPEETMIYNGDIILGKVSPIQNVEDSNKQFKDSSEIYKSHAPGVVDKVYTGIQNQDGYETRKVLIRSERTPMIGDKMCMTPDHEILTDKGWITIDTITKEHKVASLMENNLLEYHCPTDIIIKDYDDDLYVVKSAQVDLRVTKNHDMWVSPRDSKVFRKEEAEKIFNKQRRYQKNVDSYTPPNKLTCFKLPAYKEIPERELDLKAWLIFFGIWMAEGWCDMKRCCTFATHKQRVKDELDRVCLILGLTINKNKDQVNDEVLNRWSIKDKQITAYFTDISVGAINKSLPEWVWNLDTEHAKILIDGMILGDGHTMTNGTRRYDTSSKQLANDFQRLCLHAGFSASLKLKYKAGKVSVGKTKTITSTVDSWRLTIIHTQNTPLVNKNKGDGQILDSYEKYKGKVYCCSVPGKGVIYVRREGCPVWIGNCSRHGQKGTIGILLPSIDMPYNKHGIRPDIILNPNAIPSRQTIGQLLEALVGKVAALDCFDGDGTPFEDFDIKKIEDRLEELGYDPKGYEELYNGMTGEKLKVKIYFGPTYYQRLKHMVQDKLHGRARGPRTILTRQPPEGRSRDGGLRLGEMERDSMISHGISKFLHEKMMYNSDAYATYICDECGLFAHRAQRRENKKEPSSSDIYYCSYCNNSNRISKIMIPYAFKLLMQELIAMNIAPRIRTKKIEY